MAHIGAVKGLCKGDAMKRAEAAAKLPVYRFRGRPRGADESKSRPRVYVSEEVAEKLRIKAQINRRSMTAEAEIALEAWLK